MIASSNAPGSSGATSTPASASLSTRATSLPGLTEAMMARAEDIRVITLEGKHNVGHALLLRNQAYVTGREHIQKLLVG